MRHDHLKITAFNSENLPRALFSGVANYFLKLERQGSRSFFSIFNRRRESRLINQAEILKELAQYDFKFKDYRCMMYLHAIFSKRNNALQKCLAREFIVMKCFILNQEIDPVQINEIALSLVKEYLDEAYQKLPPENLSNFLKEIKEILYQDHQNFEIGKISSSLNEGWFSYIKGLKEAEISPEDRKLSTLVNSPLYEPKINLLVKGMVGFEEIGEMGTRLTRG